MKQPAGQQPQKILFYLPALVDGGAERVMAELAASFKADGAEVLFAVDFEAGANSPAQLEEIAFFELQGSHLATVRKLARLMRREQPDIAISAIASANFKLVLAKLLCRFQRFFSFRRKRPAPRLVLSYHGFDEFRTGWMSWLGYVSLPLISRIADRIVTVSDSLRLELVRRWKSAGRHTLRIYNPVSVPQAAADEPSQPAEKTILSVGRLVPGKRFDLLIEAFSRLQDDNARLVILGEGDERPRLEQLIETLGLGARVDMPGYQQHTGPYYAAASCFALASEKESFGLVLVEALAFGLPVISTDSGGPREVLDNGRYGVLLTEPDIEDFTEALEHACAHPGDPEPRILRARTFSRESGFKQYKTLFSQILNPVPEEL